MAEQNLDEYSSSSKKTVILKDWWLIKCSNEIQGKQFGVSGTQISDSVETRATRGVFRSSPIIKAYDVFTLEASDGICIILRGFLNKERVAQCGFSPEIYRSFVFGFPPYWEQACKKCFQGVSDEASTPFLSPCKNTKRKLDDDKTTERRGKSTMTEINDKDGHSVKQTARRKYIRLQSKSGGEVAEGRKKPELVQVQRTSNDGDGEGLDKAKSSVIEKDGCEAINKGVIVPSDNIGKATSVSATGELLTSEQGRGELKVTDASPRSLFRGGSRASDKQTARKKFLHLQPKSGGKVAEGRKKRKSVKVQKTSNDGDSEGLDKAKSSVIEKDGCETNDQGTIVPQDGRGRKHTDADNIGKITSMSANEELLKSEQVTGKSKVARASSRSLFNDLGMSSKPVRKGISKKSGKTLKSNSSVVEPMNPCGSTVQSADHEADVNNLTTDGGYHGGEGLDSAKINDVEKNELVPISSELIPPADECGKRHSATDSVAKLTSKKNTARKSSKDINNTSKPRKKGEAKKSRKTLKSDRNEVEPVNHPVSGVNKAEESFSGGNTNRKIDFDVEVTPKKEVKKQMTSPLSTDSIGHKRSRSGRVLLSPLEFWRNQIPVYDMNRNLTQVKEGRETDSTPSKGKGTGSSKAKKMKTK